MKKFMPAFIALLIGMTCFTIGYQTKASATEPETAVNIVQEVSGLEMYDRISDDLNIVQVLDSKDIDAEVLENRCKDGTIIIEKVIGEVLDSEMNGVVLNGDGESYINYSRVDGAQKGSVVLTYFIYNPDSPEVDDIIARFDYIIER